MLLLSCFSFFFFFVFVAFLFPILLEAQTMVVTVAADYKMMLGSGLNRQYPFSVASTRSRRQDFTDLPA